MRDAIEHISKLQKSYHTNALMLQAVIYNSKVGNKCKSSSANMLLYMYKKWHALLEK
ncbi:hypothetical protein [Agathobacter sp.]